LRRLDFILIDVFTDVPFGGSRLTLFPDADGLPDGLMQKLAQEMGGGESAFVLDAGRRSSTRAQLRTFTPEVEIPFAGHAILGATFALECLGRLRPERTRPFFWQLEAGRYEVGVRQEGERRIYSLLNDPPVYIGQYFHRQKVARALGLDEQEIAITGLPCEVVSTGLPMHIVPIGSLEAIRSIRLHRSEADAIARDLGFGDLFVFTCETVSPGADVHCRMFAPHLGIPEDPASGAGVGALLAYLVKHRLLQLQERVRVVCEQGLEMGRPSRLVAEAELSGGQAVRVHVGGECVMVGRGNIELA
jgi:trans-2,3-dihydro-3-hydroxyanthranilate isomerase